MEKKKLVPVGTTVYYWQIPCAGVVSEHLGNEDYPLEVEFGDERFSVTPEGKVNKCDYGPSISLTSYDLVNGGFTPLSEWDKPKLGDHGFFWGIKEDLYELQFGVITEIDEEGFFQRNKGTYYCNFSRDIPEWFERLVKETKQ